MPIKKKEPGKSKNLAQGNAIIHGEFFGPFTSSLPLIEGENQAEYQSFHDGCLRAIKPKDAVEVVWIQDFIYYTWEARRWKRFKAALIQAKKRDAVESFIRNFADENLVKIAAQLAKEWSRGEQETVEFVNDMLEKHGLDDASIMAMAVEICLETLESLDRSIASYDYRRDVAIQLLEKRRDLLAKRARDFGETLITDVEPQELDEGIDPIPASFN